MLNTVMLAGSLVLAAPSPTPDAPKKSCAVETIRAQIKKEFDENQVMEIRGESQEVLGEARQSKLRVGEVWMTIENKLYLSSLEQIDLKYNGGKTESFEHLTLYPVDLDTCTADSKIEGGNPQTIVSEMP